MGVHSGRFGVVNGQSAVRNWQISDNMSAKRFYASNTQNGAGRRAGVREWTGSFGAYGGQPLIMPGESFSFAGYTAPDNDTLAGVGTVYTGSALVDSVALTWDWRNAELLAYVVNFSGHLALTATDADTALSDATQPDPEAIVLCKIQKGTSPTYEEVPNIATAVLTLTAENQSYVNSSTVVSGEVWTGRNAGNIDWTLALTLDENARSGTGIPAIGDRDEWKLFINATEFWLLKWGQVESWQGINVDIEAGTTIPASINIGMDGHNGSGTGEITLPDLTTFWP